ncbi:protein GOLM2 isoform X2 [Spea bombifrons]|uniref:protein GOLM2 isoform X2 n=1 Tax=Spea bombifrons TaxID=233779 RepID=UPI00234954E6|nr:protein GOLM2 isoform X2 [Spea bombifrons]
MVGFGAPRRTGRLPPFVLVALLAVIGLLAFNYWSVSARQAALHDELMALQAQVQRTEVARSRLEKRNSEMMMQADSHRRQMEQRQGEFHSLEERLQARDLQAQRCGLDMAKLQTNLSSQIVDINHLKEQLAELRQEFLRQEDQLHEFKRNNTLLQKMLQEQSQQCTQQLADQKREYENSLKKIQVEEKTTLEKTSSKDVLVDKGAENEVHTEAIEKQNNKAEDPSANRLAYSKDAVKVDGDAGMPEIEDSDPAKEDTVATAGVKLEKALLSNEGGVQAPEKHPSMQPNPFTESKVKYIPTALKKESGLPLAVNDLNIEPLVPKQSPREPKAIEFPNLKQSRFFDENESPVDPQHGSKVADYNGDDGNVGEYEADKQAELAYNEEDDGDGGEDVQDDIHDGQGDAAEYRKDRFGETL